MTTEDHTSRIVELTGLYERLRGLFQLGEPRPELQQIDLAVARRRFRMEHLRKQIAELEEEIGWLASELEGLDRGRELLLTDAIDEIQRAFPQTWSPTPVHGYRLWSVKPDGFHGFRQQWVLPTLDAKCSQYPDDEVPHTDGRCGPLQCGIYAAKDVRHLLTAERHDLRSSLPYAVGLVGLSGKVVEHSRGYRAARATVLALVIFRSKAGPLFLDDPREITGVFLDPLLCRTADSDASAGDPIDQAVHYLEEQRRNHRWISENKSE